jgi:hypothetical protein
MGIGLPTAPLPVQTPLSTTASESADFDRRWADWQAKGAVHDRAVRRKMAIGAPILIIVAAVVYALLGR